MFLPLQSPHWAAAFFRLSIYTKLQLAESCLSWAMQQMEALLFLSSHLGQIHTWEKPQLKSTIQVRVLERKMFLATYSILKGYYPYALNVSVLSPLGERSSKVLCILIFTAWQT